MSPDADVETQLLLSFWQSLPAEWNTRQLLTAVAAYVRQRHSAADLVRVLTGDDIQDIVGSPGRLPDAERDRIRSAIAQAIDVGGIAHTRIEERNGSQQ